MQSTSDDFVIQLDGHFTRPLDGYIIVAGLQRDYFFLLAVCIGNICWNATAIAVALAATNSAPSA